MSSQIPNTYDVKYRENMRFALNQQMSKFRGKAMEESASGEKFLLQNIVGNDDVNFRTVRNRDTQYGETDHDRVWVAQPGAMEYARLVDKLDQVASGIDLKGAYVQGGAQALRRGWDGVFIGGWDGTGGFFGNMLTGKTGTTLTPFAAGNVVAVDVGAAAATGMNVAKIQGARKILAQNYVNMDQPFYMGITAEEVDDLYGQVEVTSDEFRAMGGRLSSDGKRIIGMLGFEFVEIELGNPRLPYSSLTLDGNGYRKNPFWTADGMAYAVWEELFTSVDTMPGKGHSTQVFARSIVNATRTDNGRCGYILNKFQ